MKRFFRLSAALAALALLSGCASLLHPRLVEDLQLIQTIGSSAGASITLYLALFFACTFALRKKRL